MTRSVAGTACWRPVPAYLRIATGGAVGLRPCGDAAIEVRQCPFVGSPGCSGAGGGVTPRRSGKLPRRRCSRAAVVEASFGLRTISGPCSSTSRSASPLQESGLGVFGEGDQVFVIRIRHRARREVRSGSAVCSPRRVTAWMKESALAVLEPAPKFRSTEHVGELDDQQVGDDQGEASRHAGVQQPARCNPDRGTAGPKTSRTFSTHSRVLLMVVYF